jgi:PadR family transcriptional regulator PadR
MPDLIAPPIPLILLAALNTTPSYGYDLVKRLNALATDLFTFREGTLYPVLHRLEKQRLIKANWQPTPKGQKGPRRRRYYSVTPAGKKALAQSLQQWDAYESLTRRATRKK